MTQNYVDWHDGGYWIAGTRVSLDSVVYAFLEGLSPESISETRRGAATSAGGIGVKVRYQADADLDRRIVYILI
jgi:hypothetical protein